MTKIIDSANFLQKYIDLLAKKEEKIEKLEASVKKHKKKIKSKNAKINQLEDQLKSKSSSTSDASTSSPDNESPVTSLAESKNEIDGNEICVTSPISIRIAKDENEMENSAPNTEIPENTPNTANVTERIVSPSGSTSSRISKLDSDFQGLKLAKIERKIAKLEQNCEYLFEDVEECQDKLIIYGESIGVLDRRVRKENYTAILFRY